MTTSTDRRIGTDSAKGIKAPCKVATSANITLSGLQTIDGVLLVAGDRILVRSQADSKNNGIYIADTGTWERAADFDSERDIATGTLIKVTSGSVYSGGVFELTTAEPITIGSSNITLNADVNFVTVSPFMQTLLDDTSEVNMWATLGVTDFIQTLLDDSTSNTALTTLTTTRSETGAVAVPVLTKLREVVSVEDFGAVGDGLTNDTTAFTDAMNAAKRINLQGKTYMVNLSVTKSGRHFYGVGESTILKSFDAVNPTVLVEGNVTNGTISDWGFHDLYIDGNTTAKGLHVKGTSPFVVTRGKCDHLQIKNCTNHIKLEGVSASEVYQNVFDTMALVHSTAEGIRSSGGSYNKFSSVEITECATYSVYDTQGNNTYIGFNVDGEIRSDGQNNVWISPHIEGIYAAAAPTGEAFRLGGIGNVVVSLGLQEVPAAKAGIGLSIYSLGNDISDLRIWQTDYPTYPITLDPASGGTLGNIYGLYGFKLEQYTTENTLRNWNIIGKISSISDLPPTSVLVGTSLPTASEAFRGRWYLLAGGAGVADILYVCTKDVADAYNWVVK